MVLVVLRLRLVVFDGRGDFFFHLLIGVRNGAFDLVRLFGRNGFLLRWAVFLRWQHDRIIRIDRKRCLREGFFGSPTEARIQGDLVGDVRLVGIEKLLDGAGDVLGIDSSLQVFVCKSHVIGHRVLAKDEVGHT